MANPAIATMSRAQLCAALPETVEIRKSEGGKKFPLYISTPWGAWFFNSRAGQDVLLEHGQFKSAAIAEPLPEIPEEIPEETPEPPKKKGFLESFFEGGDDE